MDIIDKRIDGGKAFDWGKTSQDYAKYRDIYPEIFYSKIVSHNLCCNGQKVLDLGTGTGVLPRNMYRYGAEWTGIDISPEQIEQAKLLAEKDGMNINFKAVSAENADFSDASFDVVTACQCFWYFDHEKITPMLYRLLKKDGKLVILYMAWLPFEDEIAGKSEELVLKYNPKWSGAGETRKPIFIPDAVLKHFELEYHEEYDVKVPFTRETWNGRIKACRGIGASLSKAEIDAWEKEHLAFLEENTPPAFEILHYAAIAILKKKPATEPPA